MLTCIYQNGKLTLVEIAPLENAFTVAETKKTQNVVLHLYLRKSRAQRAWERKGVLTPLLVGGVFLVTFVVKYT